MSTFNSPQFNQAPLNGAANTGAATLPSYVFAVCISTAMTNYRIVLTAAGGCLKPKIQHFTGYAMGDDLPIDFTLTSWPAGQTLSKAYLTLKTATSDADAAAVVQKSITITATTSGQITADGSSGTATGRIIITKSDYGEVLPDVNYAYDIQVINNSGSVYTPFVGNMSFLADVTDATS